VWVYCRVYPALTHLASSSSASVHVHTTSFGGFVPVILSMQAAAFISTDTMKACAASRSAPEHFSSSLQKWHKC